MHKVVKITAIIYCIACFAIMYDMGSRTLDWLAHMVPFSALVFSPQIFILFTSKKRSGKRLKTLFAFQVLISIFGLWGFYDAAFVHIDPQGGLVFLFLPIYQLTAFFIFYVFLKLTDISRKKKQIS